MCVHKWQQYMRVHGSSPQRRPWLLSGKMWTSYQVCVCVGGRGGWLVCTCVCARVCVRAWVGVCVHWVSLPTFGKCVEKVLFELYSNYNIGKWAKEMAVVLNGSCHLTWLLCAAFFSVYDLHLCKVAIWHYCRSSMTVFCQRLSVRELACSSAHTSHTHTPTHAHMQLWKYI